MFSKLKLLLTSITFFITFIYFSLLVHKNIFTNFDFNMTVRLQDHISANLIGFFSALSILGRIEITGLLLVILLILLRKLKAGLLSLFLFAFMHLFEIYGKVFVNHLPPPNFLLKTLQFIQFPQYYVNPVNSYPSGHSARAIFVTVFLGLIVSNKRKISLMHKLVFIAISICYDIVMLTSRVYLGEHWTSDIIGGALLGASVGILASLPYF